MCFIFGLKKLTDQSIFSGQTKFVFYDVVVIYSIMKIVSCILNFNGGEKYFSVVRVD